MIFHHLAFDLCGSKIFKKKKAKKKEKQNKCLQFVWIWVCVPFTDSAISLWTGCGLPHRDMVRREKQTYKQKICLQQDIDTFCSVCFLTVIMCDIKCNVVCIYLLCLALSAKSVRCAEYIWAAVIFAKSNYIWLECTDVAIPKDDKSV